MTLQDWQRLLPDEDFRFRIGVRKGDPHRFFAPPHDSEHCLQMRRRALQEAPQRYVAALPTALPHLQEAAAAMAAWRGAGTIVPDMADALALAIAAGERFEPDWVLLSPDVAARHPIMAGAVCFPSSWSLPAKLGLPIHDVHAPVPTLQEDLGSSIDTFLTRLLPDAFWERENWGLAADDELDHHLEKPTPPLHAGARASSTWLRWERQLLTRLPATGVIVFAIHLSVHRLDAMAAMPEVARRLARALETMPPHIAAYKGLTECRLPLAKELTTVSHGLRAGRLERN